MDNIQREEIFIRMINILIHMVNQNIFNPYIISRQFNREIPLIRTLTFPELVVLFNYLMLQSSRIENLNLKNIFIESIEAYRYLMIVRYENY